MPKNILDLISDPYHQQEYKQQQNALEAVDKYLAVSAHQHALQSELAQKADTADFLRKHSKLNPTSATYENDVGNLFAEHPRTMGPAVENALGSAKNTRSVYLNAVASGGADEFSTGSPEQQAYITRFRQTKDPVASRAHALNTAKGEETIKTLMANKLFDPAKDFPEWDGTSENRPKVYNPDGTINYHEIGLLGAQRAGEISGKMNMFEEKQVTDARNLLKSFNDDPETGSSPEAEALKPILLKRIIDHEMKQSGGTPAAATPAPKSVDSFLIRRK